MGKALVISCAAFSAIGGFLFGYDSGIISSTIAQHKFIEYFENPSDATAGGIVSAFQGKNASSESTLTFVRELTAVFPLGGAIIGALSVTYLGDKLGRKRMIFLGAIFAVFGCALQGGAATIGMLIAGRFFAGIAVGQLSSTVPVYCVRFVQFPMDGTVLISSTVRNLSSFHSRHA